MRATTSKLYRNRLDKLTDAINEKRGASPQYEMDLSVLTDDELRFLEECWRIKNSGRDYPQDVAVKLQEIMEKTPRRLRRR